MVQVEGMLSASELEERARSGDIDTILVVFPDLQGRLVGKRVTGHFWCEQMKAGSGDIHACNYLLAVDSEMTVLPGYEFANWEQGLRRLRAAPRPHDDPRDPVARTHRARDVRSLRRGDERADRGVAPPHPATPGRARRRARLLGDDGVGARVLPLQGVTRRGRGEGLHRPHAALARRRGLPHPPDDARRVPHPRHPQRDGRRGRAGRVLEGRGRQGPARDQPRLRRRGDDGRPPRDLQERCEGDRRRSTGARSRSWRSTRWTTSARRATCTRACGTPDADNSLMWSDHDEHHFSPVFQRLARRLDRRTAASSRGCTHRR